MEKKSENKFLSFIKQRIFFLVDKEQKEYVRQEVMEKDHKAFKIILIVVFILQAIMMIYRILTNKGGFDSRDLGYIISYASLAGCCIIALIVSDYLYSKKRKYAYFVVVAIMVQLLFIWALAISCLDSFKGTNLTTYAYATVAIAAIVILEPWVFIAGSILWCTSLCLSISFCPSLQIYPSVIISAISIGLLISIISVVNFARRIDSILLQKEVIELNGVLQKQSHVDSLTGINNRLFLTEHINDALSLGITPSGVIMFDIDDFKKINDEYGHQTGDDCLTVIGNLTNVFVKSHSKSYAVRYGGEEFLIFIQKTDKMTLLNEAEQFRKTIEDQVIKTNEGYEIKLTISVGIALAQTGQNFSGLINKADSYLYKAKGSGKNKVCFE